MAFRCRPEIEKNALHLNNNKKLITNATQCQEIQFYVVNIILY